MEPSSRSLEIISSVDPASDGGVCRCGRRFDQEDEVKAQRHFGAAFKRAVAGWLRLGFNPVPPAAKSSKQTELSASASSLSLGPCSHCHNRTVEWLGSDDRVNGERGRLKSTSWSKWKKRLASRSWHRKRLRGASSPERKPTLHHDDGQVGPPKRALPPVPSPTPSPDNFVGEASGISADETVEDAGIAYVPPPIDLATIIEKVKSYGWYWGPISREASEHLLANEPDGSFIVRDSSADHYIFTLTFKLNENVSHVRIENDQGFSFGSLTTFKSNTIVDFIENAVEHSRSGRYLFFLHRRPERGPMRVQLLNPVSRFKQVQSLQHLCRFVILKLVPRVLLPKLPVPQRIRAYLDTPFYFSEAIADSALPGNEPMTQLAA